MQTILTADRAGKAGAQHYTFPTVSLRYVSDCDPSELPCIRGSAELVDYAWPLFEDFITHHEEFHILLMSRSNQVVGHHQISKGGISSTVVDIRFILQAAILSNSSGIFMLHNHPSGRLMPSEPDRKLTKKVVEACRYFDLAVLDHLILAPNKSFYSFASQGEL